MNLSMIKPLLSVLPMSERLSLGVQVLVIGMATVFAVLITLWLVLLLFKLFAYTLPQKRNSKATAAIESTPLPDNKVTSFDIKGEEADTEKEIVAAITAALVEYRANAGVSLPFRVVSYKRVRGANGWNGNDTNETI